MAQNSQDKNRPDKLLNHLKSIGPYKNSSNQQDEKRAENDNYRTLDPIDIALPLLEKYIQILRSCLQNRQSRFFFITGHAGDGKTYFLRSVCTAPELFGLSESAWRLVLNDRVMSFTVDAEGNAIESSCVYLSPDSTAVNHITSVCLPHLSLKLNIVTDLSGIDVSSAENHLLINMLEQTALLAAHDCPADETAAGFDRITAKLRAQMLAGASGEDGSSAGAGGVCGSCAGADGVGGRSAGADGVGSSCAGAAGAGGRATGTGDSAAEGDWQFMITLVAGNKGRILRLFQTCREMDDSSSMCSIFPELAPDMDNVVRNIEEHMLTEQTFKSSFMQLLSFSDLMDRDGVLKIITALTEHPAWENCSACKAVEDCPVRANRKVLMDKDVQSNLCDVFEIIHDEGMKLNMRRMQILLSNAIIGNRNEQSGSDRCYTCKTCCNDVESERRSGKKAARRSSPFDNLLGLNLRRTDITGDYVDLFKMLRRIGPGSNATHLINSFILSGADRDCSLSADATTADAAGAVPGISDEQSIRRQALERLYARTVSNPDFDVTGSYEVLRQALQQCRKNSMDDDDAANTVDINRVVSALRRQLFFTMPMPGDGTRLDVFGESIWDLSDIRYGRQYLELKRHLRTSFDLTDDSMARMVRQLLNGLNCAFTALPVLDSEKHVYVTTNNRINPAAYSVLPHPDRYVLLFDGTSSQFNGVIKLINSGLLEDSRGLPAFAWFSAGDEPYAGNSTAGSAGAADDVSDQYQALARALEKDQDLLNTFTSVFAGHKDKKRFKNIFGGAPEKFPLYKQLEEMVPYLRRRSEDGDLTDHEESFLTRIEELADQVSQYQASCVPDSRVSYPPAALINGYSPVPAASMILTPSLFSYLMSLGAGMSAVSFTQECSDAINIFKDHLDHRIRELRRLRAGKDGRQLSSDNDLSTLRFCVINEQGKLTASS